MPVNYDAGQPLRHRVTLFPSQEKMNPRRPSTPQAAEYVNVGGLDLSQKFLKIRCTETHSGRSDT